MRRKYGQKTGIIVGALAVVLVGLIGITIWQKNSGDTAKNVELTQVIEASDESGNFPELIVGNPDAPVKIIEYGDYQCTACAPMNPYINELIDEYDGKVAVVFRTMIMSYHQNGTAAASAALAAYKQGYWKEYKDLLFKNQDDWYYSDSTERQKQFEEYLMTVSNNKADLEQFRKDMASEEVAKKISFDAKLSDRAKVEWTPYFMIDGELVSQKGLTTAEFISKLKDKIDSKLNEQA